MNPGPTLIDLFCGAGGLTLGLHRLGFTTAFAADSWAAAIASYNANFTHPAQLVRLDDGIELPHADVIVGGPPCQGFSSAGTRHPQDPRNSLVSIFATLVVRSLPSAFVFENVEGFLTAAEGKRVFDLLDPLIEAGYRIHVRKINAANFGIPQHRKRVIAIGGLGWEPEFPSPSHVAPGAPGSLRAVARGLPSAPSVLVALSGLPEPSVAPPGEPGGHFSRPVATEDRPRIRALKPGMTMKDLPEELWHPSYRRRAFRRVIDGTPTERRGGAPAGLRRLLPDYPSKAITSGAVSDFLHPLEDRPLTLRECARLQTFPDSFAFLGTQAEQALLIANAVPPLLGEVIGRALLAGLSQSRLQHRAGALLSFVPTTSSGASPALARLAAAVENRFGVHYTQLELLPN